MFDGFNEGMTLILAILLVYQTNAFFYFRNLKIIFWNVYQNPYQIFGRGFGRELHHF